MKIFKELTDYEKIRQVLDHKGIKPTQAERMAKIGTSTISKMKQRKDGDGSLHKDNLEKFLRTFHVNPIWWETGQGDMILTEDPKESGDHENFKHQIFEGDYIGLHKRAWDLFEDAMRTDKDLLKDLAATIKNLTQARRN